MVKKISSLGVGANKESAADVFKGKRTRKKKSEEPSPSPMSTSSAEQSQDAEPVQSPVNDEQTVLDLGGKVSIDTVNALHQQVTQAEWAGEVHIKADQVEYADFAGIQWLSALHYYWRQAGIEGSLGSVSEALQRKMDLFGYQNAVIDILEGT